MVPEIKNQILIAYFQAKEKYDKLAFELRRLLDIDPDFPHESIYTIKHRLKKEDRLVEKLEADISPEPIDANNYQDKIFDLLGLRIVCLRHSDVQKIEQYLNSLKEENKLLFAKEPERKLPPYLWVEKKEGSYPDGDIQYSGYSSVHYIVKPGSSAGVPPELSNLCCEIQVRTILEEAWGEIDHKYRYEVSRKGTAIPSSIDRGFRAFSAYLQAATIQVEYLCKDIEDFIDQACKSTTTQEEVQKETQQEDVSNIEDVIKHKFNFTPSERTLRYIERRMNESNYYEKIPQILNDKILTEKALQTFANVYKGIMNKSPFEDINDRDIDILNVINFSLFRLVQLEDVATENLKSVLQGRTRREN